MAACPNRFEFLRRCRWFFTTLTLISLIPAIATADDDKHPVIVEVAKQLGDRATDKPFVLHVGLTSKDGKGQQIVQAMRAATAPTRNEPGNTAYLLMRSPTDKNTFAIHERWKSLEALASHLQEPHTVELLATFDAILDAPPTLTVMQTVRFPGGGQGREGKGKRNPGNKAATENPTVQ